MQQDSSTGAGGTYTGMSKYEQVIEWVFRKNFSPGNVRVRFTRDELVEAHDALGIPRTKNIGDIPYSFRFRRELPSSILETAPQDSEWIIVGTGIAEYQFRLSSSKKDNTCWFLVQKSLREI